MAPSRLLTTKEIAEETGLAMGTLTAYHARGQMPPPDKQFGRTPLWREATIRKWRAKIEKRLSDQQEKMNP